MKKIILGTLALLILSCSTPSKDVASNQSDVDKNRQPTQVTGHVGKTLQFKTQNGEKIVLLKERNKTEADSIEDAVINLSPLKSFQKSEMTHNLMESRTLAQIMDQIYDINKFEKESTFDGYAMGATVQFLYPQNIRCTIQKILNTNENRSTCSYLKPYDYYTDSLEQKGIRVYLDYLKRDSNSTFLKEALINFLSKHTKPVRFKAPNSEYTVYEIQNVEIRIDADHYDPAKDEWETSYVGVQK